MSALTQVWETFAAAFLLGFLRQTPPWNHLRTGYKTPPPFTPCWIPALENIPAVRLESSSLTEGDY